MPGLSDHRRDAVLTQVRSARQTAESGYKERFKLFGIWADCPRHHSHIPECYVVPAEQIGLSTDDQQIRRALDVVLQREAVGVSTETSSAERARRSVVRLITGAAFTFLNRLAALRAMEVRGLIDEAVVRRSRYGERSLREYRLTQENAGLGPDQILERALREAFFEAAGEIGAVFDPADPYGLALPDPRTLRELHRTLGEEITEADWRADDILGWFYQYYQDEARRAFRTGRGRGQRQAAADADELAAINCLYTPHWVVRLLVDNSLGRLLLEQQGQLDEAAKQVWTEQDLREPSGDTVAEFCRYLDPGTREGGARPKRLREVRVLDPACGSGHFLIYAFDVLWRAYRQAEPDVAPEEHASAILEHNLFGIDIDLRACQLAALGLYLKAKEHAPDFRPKAVNIVCADVRILDGGRREAFLRGLGDDQALQRVAERLLRDLRSTGEIGSLLRVREPFEALFRTRRQRAKAEQAGLFEAGHVQLELEDVVPRERTISEIVAALQNFERDAIERSDMGSQLFAADAERSLGLLSLLSQQYDAILMNPPYNKRQELPTVTREYLTRWFGRTQNNIYAAFIEQTVDLTGPGGFVGMLTPLAYLYLEQLRLLRTEILATQAPPQLVAEFGWDILDPAQIQTAAAVLRVTATGDAELRQSRTFWDLTGPKGSPAKEATFTSGLAALRQGGRPIRRYLVSLDDLAVVPGFPFAYWAPEGLRRAFAQLPPLDPGRAANLDEKIADVKVGLQTSDDAQFTRRWWEVPASQIGRGRRWVPFIKGEEYARWYHDPTLVVLWDNSGYSIKNFRDERGQVRSRPGRGEDFYFFEGLTWQRVNANRRVRTRYLPPGCIFADKGPSIFPAAENIPHTFALLGLLNSSLVNLSMLMLTPERGWEVGQVSRLPVQPRALRNSEVANAARELHDILAAWDTGKETSSQFVFPQLLQVARPVPDTSPTGHPLAADFAWPNLASWAEIAALRGSPDMPLKDLLDVLSKRRNVLQARIDELEQLIDREVFRCYGLEDQAAVVLQALGSRLGLAESESGETGEESGEDREQVEPSEEAQQEVTRLLSYYVKQTIEAADSPVVPLDTRTPGNLLTALRDHLRSDWGEQRTAHLEDEIHDVLGHSLEDWLVHDYFPFHVRLYNNRPVFWLLWSGITGRGRGRRVPAFACFLDYKRLTTDTLRLIRGRWVARALDEARAEAERREREATEERIGGGSQSARLRAAAEEAQAAVAELEAFDRALASVLNPGPIQEPGNGASWTERMIVEVRRGGYNPNPDLGVAVNIAPLRDAGLLHPAGRRVR